jgi:catechol 2,3-dioxygenase-like lactoylglutathione lyase family enzyme
VEPRVSLITLGVDDLERAVAFYRDGLGWPTAGIVGTEIEDGAVAFFDLAGGLKLALWPRASLARDAGIKLGPRSSTEISLAHNVASRQAVDAAFEAAVAAGGTAVKHPVVSAWGGYAGYVADPDGHLWELAWNPDLLPSP